MVRVPRPSVVAVVLAAACVEQPPSSPSESLLANADAGATAGPRPLRFVVFGDAGQANDAQYAVGSGVAKVCASLGCQFALYLGDNFYTSGVSYLDDPQFRTKFELPYASLDFPFYVVLGNHDYGLSGLGGEWWKGEIEIAYSRRNPKWILPDEHYTFERENVSFFAFDTTKIMFGLSYVQQVHAFHEAIEAGTRPWRIGFGHHPFLSNGAHGNAGHYDGLLPIAPVLPGQTVERFYEDTLCGELDVYFAGHDHNRQWLSVECGMLHVVSGAGAEVAPLAFRDANAYAYADASEPGFLWVEILGDVLHGRFYDADGNVDFEAEFTRPSRGTR